VHLWTDLYITDKNKGDLDPTELPYQQNVNVQVSNVEHQYHIDT